MKCSRSAGCASHEQDSDPAYLTKLSGLHHKVEVTVLVLLKASFHSLVGTGTAFLHDHGSFARDFPRVAYSFSTLNSILCLESFWLLRCPCYCLGSTFVNAVVCFRQLHYEADLMFRVKFLQEGS